MGENVFTMYCEGDYEFAICLDAELGVQAWEFVADKIFLQQHGSGPRATPIVDGDHVYILSGKGKLYALRVSDRKRFWQVDLRQVFKTGLPRFGFCSSPIIEGDLLMLEAGGLSGNTILAFNKNDGELQWQLNIDAASRGGTMAEFKDQPGYSSPVALTMFEQRHILFLTASRLLSVSPAGNLLWQVPWVTRNGANVAAPIVAPGNRIFVSAGYNKGAALFQISAGGGANYEAEQVWRNKVMRSQFSSSIYHDGHIYGFDKNSLKCVSVETGKQAWKKTGLGHGSLLFADNQLIVLSENGRLLLVDASAARYQERGRAKIFRKGKVWTPPSLANGRLFVRNQFEIICLNMRKPGYAVEK